MAIDETRDKLLDAAGHEFAEKGFDGATVRSICDRAGVNLAAVNYHFGDKERLYEAVIMLAHQSRPAPARGSEDLDPRAELRQYIAYFLEEAVFHQETGWQQELMVREIANPTRASDTLIREAFRPSFDRLVAILQRLSPGADQRQLHALGFSVIAQGLHYKLNRHVSERIVGPEAFGRLDQSYLVEHITGLTLAALGQGPPLGQTPSLKLDSPPRMSLEG